LHQQVRRIMGTAVAMAHGWLPLDSIESSVDRQLIVTTPLAPASHLYRAGTRYHYNEIYFKGKQLSDIDNVHKTTNDPIHWIQRQHLGDMDRDASKKWLTQLRDEVAPRIRSQFEETTGHAPASELTQARDAYTRVLKLLRELVATNQWPSTSANRSSVIGNLDDATLSGSFTVASEAKYDFSGHFVPKANVLCPTLTPAVFDLDDSLIDAGDLGPTKMTRAPSSHCAVNYNAQFTPHVDTGRGLGQSLSMIVGLGDYASGDLMVEGDAHNIRYQPLQFDGWKMRHWTRPFSGERFSLIWFTPEGMNRKQ
jgi:hypothetical protein